MHASQWGFGEERSYHGLGLEKRKEKGTKLHKKIIFVPDVDWLTFLLFFNTPEVICITHGS